MAITCRHELLLIAELATQKLACVLGFDRRSFSQSKHITVKQLLHLTQLLPQAGV